MTRFGVTSRVYVRAEKSLKGPFYEIIDNGPDSILSKAKTADDVREICNIYWNPMPVTRDTKEIVCIEDVRILD